MLFTIFGKRYLIVFPGQIYDARKLKKFEDKSGWVHINTLLVMKWGEICNVEKVRRI